MEKAKVYLVGAGPGDVGLFTLRGKQLIEDADVVVYDALVGSEILALIPMDTELIYVGKRSNHHVMTQEQINQVLVEQAKLDKKVVRLKGGDPFLFGRGGEEIEELIKEGIPFEVVSGVPSAIAVPSYAGIPVTHRDYASSVHFITGHKKANEELDLDFEAYKKCGGTYVFLMSVGSLHDIINGFLKVGMPPDTNVALISKGTRSGQKKLLGNLVDIEDKMHRAPLMTPAIIVVGGVCELAEQFEWYEKKPLAGQKIIVTRPKGRSKKLVDSLKNLGAEVIPVPTIQTVKRENQQELMKEIKNLSFYEWLVFTSPAGVDVFWQVLLDMHMDIRYLGKCKIAAIGEGTEKELKKHGLLVDLVPEKYDGKELGKALRSKLKKGDHVCIPRASVGSQELILELQKVEQVIIKDIPIYDTIFQKPKYMNLRTVLEEEENCRVVFTSSSTVKGFEELTQGMVYDGIQAFCIGEQTAKTAKDLGMRVLISKKATIDSLVELIKEYS